MDIREVRSRSLEGDFQCLGGFTAASLFVLIIFTEILLPTALCVVAGYIFPSMTNIP